MKRIILTLTIVFCLIPINILAIELNISSQNAILINLNDDEIIYEKNIDNKSYIASLTKMMTAIVAIENIDNLDEQVSITYEDLSGLNINDTALSRLSFNTPYTYRELLYGLMLPSGADCANALARLTGGSINSFVQMMNNKAQELNMINTNFSNTTGLDDPNNYSTVYDLSLLFKYALKNETFSTIIKTMTYTTTDGHNLKNNIAYYKEKYNLTMNYLIGGKTGYDTQAGFCLATIANYNNIDYMLITTNALHSLESPNHFIDANTIYKYFMDNYNYHVLINKNDVMITLDTLYAKEEKIEIKASKNYSYYVINDYDKDKIKLTYDGIETVTTKMKENDELGIIKVYYDDKLLDEIDIKLDKKLHFSLINYLILNPIYIYIGIMIILILILTTFIIIKKKKKQPKFE